MKPRVHRFILGMLLASLTACASLEVGIVQSPTSDPNTEATLSALATESAQLATRSAELEATVAVAVVTPIPTPTPLPSMTPTPTPGRTPIPRPSATPLPISSSSPTPYVASPEPPYILHFTVAPTEVDPGDSVTLTWESTGGARAWINQITPPDRYGPTLEVPTTGSTTFTIERHRRHWHTFELVMSTQQGHTVRREVTVKIRCPYTYFFTQAPEGLASCPYKPAAFVLAAEQAFQGGRMIWLEEIPADSSRSDADEGPVIYALFNTGDYPLYIRFEDTWTSDEPESDPDIVPPEGLLQPVRGFGKVWRTNPTVRERLGWALSPETGYDGAYQLGWDSYKDASDAYVRTSDGRIVMLGVYGDWSFN